MRIVYKRWYNPCWKPKLSNNMIYNIYSRKKDAIEHTFRDIKLDNCGECGRVKSCFVKTDTCSICGKKHDVKKMVINMEMDEEHSS